MHKKHYQTCCVKGQLNPCTLQVDGSSDSLQLGSSTAFQAQFTMRECEEQMTQLKKENFNLKLRIYFMEQSQGILHSPKEQENLYKINIDLKVHGEVLRKVLKINNVQF